MRPRTTLLLILIAVALAALVALDMRKGISTEQAAAQRRRLLDINSPNITRLELIRSNETIVAEKSGERWELKQPFAVRASSSAINSLLMELEFAERQRTLTAKELAGVDTTGFGLAAPRMQVKLSGKKGAVTVLIGEPTATKDGLYVQLAGQNDVIVVRQHLAERLAIKLDELRERQVLDFAASAVSRIELKSGERVVELTRTKPSGAEQARWTITRPFAARADQQRVSQLLNDLSWLRVQEFISEDARELHLYQLDVPRAEITVATGETGQTLLLGGSPTNDTTKLYAKVKGLDSIYTVSASAATNLIVQLNDLRERQILIVATNQIHGIRLVRAGQELALQRVTNGWTITAPTFMRADDARVGQLLDSLCSLRVDEFVADVATDLDKYGLAVPAAVVSLQDATTNLLAQVLVGTANATNGLTHLKQADEPFVYGLRRDVLGLLPADALALRDRQVLNLPADQVRKVTVQHTGQTVVVEQTADGLWKLVEPTSGVLDVDRVKQLVAALAPLRAEEFFASDAAGAISGLQSPVATLEVTTPMGTHRLTIGERHTEQTRFAALAEPALVFTIPNAVAERFTARLVTAAGEAAAPPATPAAP